MDITPKQVHVIKTNIEGTAYSFEVEAPSKEAAMKKLKGQLEQIVEQLKAE